MRAVVQRVKTASVTVKEQIIGRIDQGLLVFLGISPDDTSQDIAYLCDKIVNLRVFDDDQGLMNLSALDIGGSILVVSQFTLYGDCRKGRRPSYSKAARPKQAKELYEEFIRAVMAHDLPVASGEFQAMMDIHLINDGPVTLLLDSQKLF